MSQSREMLGSRLGFLLLSAGCAIGLGNVWRFPYITGAYGGAVFVGVYLLCLLAVLPVMIMEFAVGRASRSNMGRALKVLPPEGTRWHIFSKIPLWGSYLLSMFYTTVTGWMLAYCWHSFSGNLSGLDTAGVASFFGSTLASPFEQVLGMTIVVGVGYELIKFAGRKNNLLTRIISAPGMALQRITTREPDDSMIECAIASMEKVIPSDGESDRW